MGVPIRPLVPISVPIPYMEETVVEEQSNATEPLIKSIKRTLILTLRLQNLVKNAQDKQTHLQKNHF